MFMASPTYIKNPYLRAKMVEVLNCWMPRTRSFVVLHFVEDRILWKFGFKFNKCLRHLRFPSAVVHLLQLLYSKGINWPLSILWGTSWSFMLTLSSQVRTHRWLPSHLSFWELMVLTVRVDYIQEGMGKSHFRLFHFQPTYILSHFLSIRCTQLL